MRDWLAGALIAAALVAPARADAPPSTISHLPIATAVDPNTDYGVGIVQQTVNGLPTYLTMRVPLRTLVGPPGAPAFLAGINITTLPPGSPATAVVGGASPNYLLNLGIPQGAPGNATAMGTLVPGDVLLAGPLPGTFVDGGRTPSSFLGTGANLGDLQSAAAARANLGLGTLATQAAGAVAITGGAIDGTRIGGTTPAPGAFSTLSASTPIPVGSGGTGSGTAAGARAGIGAAASGANADITSLSSPALGSPTATTQAAGDASTKVATDGFVAGAVAPLAPLASPTLTGTPRAPTAAVGDASTQIATDAFVAAAIQASPSGAPSAALTLSAAYTVQPGDKGKTLVLSGSFTVTEPACSANPGLYFWIKKTDGGGVVTLQPASGTTDGLAAKSVYQEGFLEWCDGTAWRSQGRARGWISLGSSTVPSAVSSVAFGVGFADPELRDMEVVADGLTLASNDYPSIQVKKGSAYLGTGYLTAANLANGSNTQAVAPTTGVPLSYTSTTGAVSGTARVFAFASGGTAQRITGDGFDSAVGRITTASGFQTGTSGPVLGLQIVGNAGANITGGTFSQRGFRP